MSKQTFYSVRQAAGLLGCTIAGSLQAEAGAAMTIPRLLSLSEVADLLRVSPHTVRAWVRRGRLQPVRICRRLLFSPDVVSRFVSVAEPRQ